MTVTNPATNIVNSQSSEPYHSRIQKGGALWDDMRLLVRAWNESATEQQALAKGDLLGKKTKARSNDTFIRAFSPRFINGNPQNAWRLVRFLEDRNAEPEILRPVYYWITARNDRLLYDYVTQELIDVVRVGDGSVRIQETMSWIRRQLMGTSKEWGQPVVVRVARGIDGYSF